MRKVILVSSSLNTSSVSEMAISLRNKEILPETPRGRLGLPCIAELTGWALTPGQRRVLLTDVEPQKSPGYDC